MWCIEKCTMLQHVTSKSTYIVSTSGMHVWCDSMLCSNNGF
jgi:hypothetical protein